MKAGAPNFSNFKVLRIKNPIMLLLMLPMVLVALLFLALFFLVVALVPRRKLANGVRATGQLGGGMAEGLRRARAARAAQNVPGVIEADYRHVP